MTPGTTANGKDIPFMICDDTVCFWEDPTASKDFFLVHAVLVNIVLHIETSWRKSTDKPIELCHPPLPSAPISHVLVSTNKIASYRMCCFTNQIGDEETHDDKKKVKVVHHCHR